MKKIISIICFALATIALKAQPSDTLPVALRFQLSERLESAHYTETNEELLFFAFAFDKKGDLTSVYLLHWSNAKAFDSIYLKLGEYKRFGSYLNT